MHKATIALILFILLSEFCCGQQSQNAASYKEQAIKLYGKKSYRKADSTFRKCISAAREDSDWETLGNCLNNLASVQFQQGEYAQGIINYENAVTTYKENGLDTLLGESYLNLGLAYKKQSIYDSAIANFYRGIKILEQLDKKGSLIKGYNRLANTLRETVSLEKAKTYYQKALVIAKKQESQVDIANLYNNLGVLYKKQERYDSALFNLNKSLEFKSEKQFKGLGNTYYNLGEVFSRLHSVDTAATYYQRSHQNRLLAKDKFGLAHSKIVLAEIYLEQSRPNLAKRYLFEADTLVNTLNSYDLALKLRSAKRDLAILTGNFAAAQDLKQELQQLRDSILNKEKQSLITSYEVQYDVRKLQETITIKNEALMWSIAVGVLLLIIGIQLYREQRKKKEDAKKIRTLFLDMHHRIKNNLSLLSGVITHKKRAIAESTSKKTLKEIGGQIDAINLIHTKLHPKEGMEVGKIDITSYLQELVENVFVSAGLKVEDYELQFDLDRAVIAADRANPIGLIVNEVITNLIKYGISADGRWYCSVVLEAQEKHVQIVIADKGEGITSQGAIEKEIGGAQLIKILAAQIDAKSNYQVDGGTVFTLSFEK